MFAGYLDFRLSLTFDPDFLVDWPLESIVYLGLSMSAFN